MSAELPDPASPRVVTRDCLVRPPTARAKITGVSGARIARGERQALAELPGPRRRDRVVERDHEIGAQRPLEPRSITSQGLRLSESEIAQKSPPSGAPSARAAASIAVMPGSTAIVERRQAGVARLDRLEHRRRHAKTPGSPPDTTATRRPAPPVASACARASTSTRLSDACRRLTRRAPARGRDRDRNRRGRSPLRARPAPRGVSQRGVAGPRPTTVSRPLTAAALAGHEDHREIGGHVVGFLGERLTTLAPPSCRARHRPRGRAARLPSALRRTFGRLRPSFMITAASVSAQPPTSSASARCRAARSEHRRPR